MMPVMNNRPFIITVWENPNIDCLEIRFKEPWERHYWRLTYKALRFTCDRVLARRIINRLACSEAFYESYEPTVKLRIIREEVTP